MDNIENQFKKMVYNIFEIPEKTKYHAMLMELGLMKMKHYVHKMQISYMNQIVWDLEGTTVHHAVMAEWRLRGADSTLGQVDLLAEGYGLLRISAARCDRVQLKQEIKRFNQMELWWDCFYSPVVVERAMLRVEDQSYHKWDKLESQAILAWRTGSIKFKMSWRLYNVKRGMGTSCVMPVCGGEDTLAHMKVCPFYDTKWSSKWESEKEIAKYLIRAQESAM